MNTTRLAELAAEVDGEHDRAMDELDPSRRALLTGGAAALGSAAALVALGAGTRPAAGEPTSGTSAGVSTTAPRRPQPEDIELITFAQSLELAAVAAYQLVIESGLLDDQTARVARLFQRHHQEHADAHGGLAGKETSSRANAGLVELFAPRIERASSAEEALQIAYEIEQAAAATHVANIGEYLATGPAALSAAIAPVEGRHGVVLGQALGLDVGEYTPEFQTTADALSAEQYPVEPA